VATTVGDRLPEETGGSAADVPATEALQLLDQTRLALAEARDRLADSEQRAAAEHELALRLQRAIMPQGIRPMAAAGVDIAGHGIEAVTGMVTARNALRGLAVTGAEPHELIGQLNHTACLFGEGVTGTVICDRLCGVVLAEHNYAALARHCQEGIWEWALTRGFSRQLKMSSSCCRAYR